jgi:hypothetical protein
MSGLSNAAFATFRARNLAIARNILFQSASYFAFGRKIIAQYDKYRTERTISEIKADFFNRVLPELKNNCIAVLSATVTDNNENSALDKQEALKLLAILEVFTEIIKLLEIGR